MSAVSSPEFPPSPPMDGGLPGLGPSDAPPSPPSERIVQRSLREAGHGQFPCSSYIPGAGIYGSQAHEVFQQPLPSVETQMSPGQEVSTPASSTPDDDSSPSWTSSPRSKQQRRRLPPRAKAPRSPRGRKSRPQKDSSCSIHLSAPFSQSTAHLADVPLKDMHAWATRPDQQRYDEVKRRRKVARPMNAFMMYKSAYSERAKAFLKMKNFQDVNKALGKSWKMELEEVASYYIEMSKLEHKNHATAHPDYQFKPKKGPAMATRPMTPTPSHTTAALMDYGSPSSQWTGDLDFSSPPPSYNHGRSQSMEFGDMHVMRSHSNTPFEHPEMTSSYPSWNGFPSSAPTIQPSALQGNMASKSEDMRHFKCSTPLPEEIHYGVPSGLNGIPGEAHHDLMQPQHMQSSGINPQMLGYTQANGVSMEMTPTFNTIPNPYPVWDNSPATHGFLTAPPSTPVSYHVGVSATAFSPELHRNPSWDPSHHSSHDLDDSWIEL
ncbi:hypothetical protein N7478_006340 [Penicillium angulare]|uniref:uncharacterized protein n=1 Tax=Penicillium angulare TaxID=116970 RepID=UPI00254184D3|nr:uncharacterized protein N7478_006340 [Penicillium angulare]KAJ5280968.1 hypothetical protein N7478_006340 [Penicillium angulare]